MKPWSLSTREVLSSLGTSLETGLTNVEVAKRQRLGKNVLDKTTSFSVWSLFWKQWESPFLLLLLGACVVSFLTQEWVDFWVIVLALGSNVVAGFVQEYKANVSLARLQSMVVFDAQVLREGKRISVLSEELVVGDIVFVSPGHRVSADARVLEASDCVVNQAALTGESEGVSKETVALPEDTLYTRQSNMLFAGTTVLGGFACGVVTQIGTNTRVGKIGQLLKSIQEEKTPLQKSIETFSFGILWLVLGITGVVFVLGVSRGEELSSLALTSLALAVAAVPEGLLISITVILTIGMQRILKKKAIVRRLIAAETLGSVDVVCMDKTGTLTEGVLQVTMMQTPSKTYDVSALKQVTTDTQLLLETALFCNQRLNQTDIALVDMASRFVTKKPGVVVRLLPFDGKKKWMGMVYQEGNSFLFYMKGAPEMVLASCDLSAVEKERWLQRAEQLAKTGLRMLAFAVKTDGKQGTFQHMAFVGLVGLKDVVRQDVKESLHLSQQAGISLMMVTGDHPQTALFVAKEVGMSVKPYAVMTGDVLEKLTQQQLEAKVEYIQVFARILPEQKWRIVEALRKTGHVVAFVGDGVNDAPALKASDIGIALGSGTDVAKETSDMVLLNDHFKTIVHAIRQGRVIFDNMRKAVIYLLSDSFTTVVLVVGSLVLGVPLPLVAAQILWINLITDGLPSIALNFEPEEKDVMQLPPRKAQEPLINREVALYIFGVGLCTDLFLLFLYIWIFPLFYPLSVAKAMMFGIVGIQSLFFVFACRSFRHKITQISLISNRYLLWSVGISLIIFLIPFVISPLNRVFVLGELGGTEWLIIILVGTLKLVSIEFVKGRRIHRYDASRLSHRVR